MSPNRKPLRIVPYPEMNLVQFNGVLESRRFWPAKLLKNGKTKSPFFIANLACWDPRGKHVDGKRSNTLQFIAKDELAGWCGEYLRSGLHILVIGLISRDRFRVWKTKGYRWTTQIKAIQIYLAPTWSEQVKEALMHADTTRPVVMDPSWGELTEIK